MPLSKVTGVLGRLIRREARMWASGLGICVLAFAFFNRPLWFNLQLHELNIEYPNVEMKRTVTLPIRLRYREEVENSRGYIFARCDRTQVRAYEWRGLEPVSFDMRCTDLPPGENYTYRVCWFDDGSYLGCRETDFDVPADGRTENEVRSSSPSESGNMGGTGGERDTTTGNGA